MIEIEQLILRIPNITPEEGRQMSEQVGRQIAASLPAPVSDRYIEHLGLQIKISENWSQEQIVSQISKSIVARINNFHPTPSYSDFSENYSEGRRSNQSIFSTPKHSNQ